MKNIIIIGLIFICAINLYMVYDYKQEVQILSECNDFKYELCEAQFKLIDYQDSLINLIDSTEYKNNNHCFDDTYYTTSTYDSITYYGNKVDSLLNTQL